MASMEEVEGSILADLHRLDDEMLRYSFLIECGRNLPKMSESLRTDEHLVRECEVKTWFAIGESNGARRLEADSESLIVRGALALIFEVLDAGDEESWPLHHWRILDDQAFCKSFTDTQLRGLNVAISRLRQSA